MRGKAYRCRLNKTDIRTVVTCPKTVESSPWSIEEEERLLKLASSGTHLRNVALILERPYSEVLDRVKP